MAALFEIRENILRFYRRYENFITPAFRFLVILLAMIYINGKIGYRKTLTGVLPVMIISLISTLLPGNAVAAVMGLVILVLIFLLQRMELSKAKAA